MTEDESFKHQSALQLRHSVLQRLQTQYLDSHCYILNENECRVSSRLWCLRHRQRRRPACSVPHPSHGPATVDRWRETFPPKAGGGVSLFARNCYRHR